MLNENVKKTIESLKKEQVNANDSDLPQENEFNILTPAQDFLAGRALVTVPIQVLRENKICKDLYVITSKKEKIPLKPDDLAQLELYYERTPSPKPRWTKRSIEAYLSGKVTGDIKDDFKVLTNIFATYVDFADPRICQYLALWVIGTYFHRMFSAFPYIHLNGNMGSGKSKVLQIISLVAFNAEHSVGNSPAYTIRSIHDNSATCCVDEAENLDQTKDDDLKVVIMMYNSGYKKGATVGKTELGHGKKWEPKEFESYAPKIFAGIKELIPTLSSRCVPIMMVNSSNAEIKNREIVASSQEWRDTRNRLYLSMMESHEIVLLSYNMMQDEVIQGREWELWKPILAIANVIDETNGSLVQGMHALAIETQNSRKEAQVEDSTAPKLILNFQQLLKSHDATEKFYSIVELLDYLKTNDAENFGWLENNKHGRWLGHELRKAGIVSGRAQQKKIESVNTKGFNLTLAVIEDRLKSFNL